MLDNEDELLNAENFDRMGKHKSISDIDNSSGDTVISKKIIQAVAIILLIVAIMNCLTHGNLFIFVKVMLTTEWPE